jgi:hypothetical protein
MSAEPTSVARTNLRRSLGATVLAALGSPFFILSKYNRLDGFVNL